MKSLLSAVIVIAFIAAWAILGVKFVKTPGRKAGEAGPRAVVLAKAKVAMNEWSRTEFLGHTYIVWEGTYAGGMVHDPDCVCRKARP